MKITSWIIDGSKEYNGTTQSFLMENGIVGYTEAETFESYNKRHNGVMKVITSDELSVLEKAYRKRIQKPFLEISAEEYDFALGELPPKKWNHFGGGVEVFFCSEAYTRDLHACFVRLGDKYYSALRSIFGDQKEYIKEVQGN